jgi:hypothetical protein
MRDVRCSFQDNGERNDGSDSAKGAAGRGHSGRGRSDAIRCARGHLRESPRTNFDALHASSDSRAIQLNARLTKSSP